LKTIFVANTDWFIFNFLISLAKHLRDRGVEVVMVSPPGAFGHKLRDAGFRWIPISMERRSLGLSKEAAVLRQLTHIYRAERPDIAHHFTIKCVVYGGLAARAAGVNSTISAITGLGYIFISRDTLATILRPLVRALLKFSIGGAGRRVIIENKDDLEYLLRHNIAKIGEVRVIDGLGVNTELFRPTLGLSGKKKGPTRIVFAARLLWDKGLAELVDAIKVLLSEGQSAEFFIAGTVDPGNPSSVSAASRCLDT
jgi:glycosyltransferase involved in cell wall biosynthesis